MKIRKGDNVFIVSGSDKGKTGKVIKAFPDKNQILVEGINIKKKHQKSRRSNQKGQIVEKPGPISVSNAQLIDPKNNLPTRVRIDRKSGKALRISTKTGAVIEK